MMIFAVTKGSKHLKVHGYKYMSHFLIYNTYTLGRKKSKIKKHKTKLEVFLVEIKLGGGFPGKVLS
jgi:uncharacterized membrane protein YdbT with pleckstrin-like domain